MILEISNLTKIYKNNDKKALDNVSLEFRQSGLVFIVGQSGSGKSTLLNLISLMDKETSGTIEFYNQVVTDFKGREIDKYKQNIAFVFQDFALIDTLDVYDNIKMGRNDVSREDILQALDKVELSGFENRRIQTLSAGQMQRVAIARAIVKQPKTILCDEPTGNLDFLTSQSIIKCLKSMSKDFLILVVSHNLDDAYTYGTRIIELEEGHVKSDLSINKEQEDFSYLVEDGNLYLTTMKSLSDDVINKINEDIANHKIRSIRPKSSLFQEDKQVNGEVFDSVELKGHKIRFKDKIESTFKILRKQWLKSFIFSVMIGLFLSIFAISLCLKTFDRSEFIKNNLETTKIGYIYRQEQNTYKMSPFEVPPVSPNLDPLTGEKGIDYYEIANVVTFLADNGWPSARSNDFSFGLPYTLFNQAKNKFSYRGTIGTIIMNKEAFSNLFYDGKELEFIMEADEYKDYGFYITDVAYKLLQRDNVKVSMGDEHFSSSSNKTGTYINGIIKTNYEEKYPNILKYLYAPRVDAKDYEELKDDPNSYEALMICGLYMLATYSFEPDFVNNFNSIRKDIKAQINYGFHVEIGQEVKTKMEDVEFSYEARAYWNYYESSAYSYLEDDTCEVGLGMFNVCLGQNYTHEEAQAIINNYDCTCYMYNADFDVDGYEGKFYALHIVGLLDTDDIRFCPSDNINQEIVASSFYVYGYLSFDKDWYISNQDSFEEVGILPVNSSSSVANVLSKYIIIYSDLFNIILWLSIVSIIIVLFIFSYDAVRRQTYSIGVMKSIGIYDTDIFSIFGIHQILFVIFTIIFTFIFEKVFMSLANDVLIFAYEKVQRVKTNLVYDVIRLTPSIFAQSISLVIAIIVFTTILTYLIIKSIKVVKILKNKY